MNAAKKPWVMRITAVITLLVLAVMDTVVYLEWGSTATLSYQLKTANESYPLVYGLVSFTFGVLTGHFFWSQRKVCSSF